MNGCIFISIYFIKNHNEILSIDNISNMEKLVESYYPIEITSIESPVDWYYFDPTTNIFDIASKEVQDHQLRSVIIQKLDKLFSTKINKELTNIIIIEKLMESHDEENYFALLSTVETSDTYSDHQIISSIDDYQITHEHFLSTCPKSNDDYATRCLKIFDNILFSDEFTKNLSTLGNGDGILSFSTPVTKAISILNRINPSTRDINTVMSWVTRESGFECSVQGSTKKHLKISVPVRNGESKKINCEYHVKIKTSNNKDGITHYNRIYFGLMPEEHGKNCYLYHCGKHL